MASSGCTCSAVGCGLLVLAMAGCARLVADRRTAAWTAVGTAAVLSNALIDPVSAKGEVLGIPLVGASFWLVLLALRRPDRVGAVLAALAGAAAVLAVGMKQNLVAGLVFGAVAVLGSAVAGRVPPRRAGGLLLATAAGAAVPVLVVVGWSLAEDNRLHELWYGLVGFRSDAARVLAEDPGHAGDRVVLLLGVLVATGVAVLLLAFVLHLRSAWRLDPVLTAAAGAVLVVDLTTLALSGSFWLPYLFALVPGTALAILLVVGAGGRPGRRVRVVVAGAATSSALAIVGWSLVVGTGGSVPAEHRTGEAIARAAAPGDTIVVHGGRADIVLASGLRSPYPYLWSLPMRVHDPELEQLRALLASDEAPTWVVERVGLGAWSMDAAAVEATLARRYVRHGTGCLGHPVHLRRDVDRPALAVDCESPVDLVGGQDAARRMTQASSRE